jgi:hypothetical protein
LGVRAGQTLVDEGQNRSSMVCSPGSTRYKGYTDLGGICRLLDTQELPEIAKLHMPSKQGIETWGCKFQGSVSCSVSLGHVASLWASIFPSVKSSDGKTVFLSLK